MSDSCFSALRSSAVLASSAEGLSEFQHTKVRMLCYSSIFWFPLRRPNEQNVTGFACFDNQYDTK